MRVDLPAHAAPTRFFPRIGAALNVYRQRRAMLALDDHLLNDMGLIRPQAMAEAARPIRDAPQIWRR